MLDRDASLFPSHRSRLVSNLSPQIKSLGDPFPLGDSLDLGAVGEEPLSSDATASNAASNTASNTASNSASGVGGALVAAVRRQSIINKPKALMVTWDCFQVEPPSIAQWMFLRARTHTRAKSCCADHFLEGEECA